MFMGNNYLKNIDFKNLKIFDIYYMNSAFMDCENLEEIHMETFDFSNIIDMTGFLHRCGNLKKWYVNEKYFN